MTLRRRQQVLLGAVFVLSSIVDTGHGFAGFFGEEPPPGPKDKEAEAGVDIIPNPGTVAGTKHLFNCILKALAVTLLFCPHDFCFSH